MSNRRSPLGLVVLRLGSDLLRFRSVLTSAEQVKEVEDCIAWSGRRPASANWACRSRT